jgi:hypothetical protein
VIGVMGPGEGAVADACRLARRLGALIAREGWAVLCGGVAAGVMEAVCQGAREQGGLTIGVLPGAEGSEASAALDVAIRTGMGSGRNNINVLSSDVVVACGMSAGTASEVALAIKARRPVILLGADERAAAFFRDLGGDRVRVTADPEDAVRAARDFLKSRRPADP